MSNNSPKGKPMTKEPSACREALRETWYEAYVEREKKLPSDDEIWDASWQAAIRDSNAELIEAVIAAKELVEWFMQHSRQADHAHEELGQKLEETTGWKEMVDSGYNGLMASYRDQFEEALAAIDITREGL